MLYTRSYCTNTLLPPPSASAQTEAARVFHDEQARRWAELQTSDLSCYAVGGAEDEWAESLSGSHPSIISIK